MSKPQPVALTSTAYPLDYKAPPLPLPNKPVVTLRTHHDGLEDFASVSTGTINDEPSETQTQFTAECDINNILDRYTRGQAPEARAVKYGETIDYSIGLQDALTAVGDMEAIHAETIPPELRNLYPTWREWINAAANGSYEHELANLAAKKKKIEDDAAELATARQNPPTPPAGEKEKKPE